MLMRATISQWYDVIYLRCRLIAYHAFRIKLEILSSDVSPLTIVPTHGSTWPAVRQADRLVHRARLPVWTTRLRAWPAGSSRHQSKYPSIRPTVKNTQGLAISHNWAQTPLTTYLGWPVSSPFFNGTIKLALGLSIVSADNLPYLSCLIGSSNKLSGIICHSGEK